MRARGNNSMVRIAVAAAMGLALFALAPSAMAGAPRTFVKSDGIDGNTTTNCQLSAPCQTFAQAYTVTAAGGEIVALDASGYGPVTITNSVSIIAIARGFVKAPSGGTGITITGGKVILDNIEITGNGLANTTGISLTGGTLTLKNSVLTQLATGLSVNSTKADVINSDIINNTLGVSTTGTGVDVGQGFVPTTGGPTEVRLTGGNVVNNTTAFTMNSPGTTTHGGTANNITILFYLNSNTDVALTTYMAGNGTFMTGSGTGCTVGGNCAAATGFENQPSESQQ